MFCRGNGRRYNRFVQRYTQCSGDDSSPCHAANITRAVKWHHPPDMSSRPKCNGVEGSSQVANFTLRRSFLQLGWIPPLRFAQGLNDNIEALLQIRLLFPQCFTLPRRSLISLAQGRASFPTGEAFVPCRGAHRLNQTLFYPERSRNGTQAVPYGFADWCIFLHNASQKRTRPSSIIVNCPLSIVNSTHHSRILGRFHR